MTFGIIELRRYHAPRAARRMAALFERQFIESQVACGMEPLGQYRDLDDPDRFVWLRGFSDMTTRLRALTAFYRESQIWREHRDAANATLIDSDDVLPLRPARPDSGFDLAGLERLGHDAPEPTGHVAALILWLRDAATDGVVTAFERSLLPVLHAWATRRDVRQRGRTERLSGVAGPRGAGARRDRYVPERGRPRSVARRGNVCFARCASRARGFS